MSRSAVGSSDNARRFVLESYRGDGRFRFSPARSASNLYSTCFAVLALELLGELPRLDRRWRQQVCAFVSRFQRPSDGLFVDPDILASAGASHDRIYLCHQQTDFALLALQALGVSPPHPLRVLAKLEPQPWSAWLGSLDWSDPWLASNRVMFVLDFLLHEGRRGTRDTAAEVTAILDELDARQDPATGLWHRDSAASRLSQMAATYHFLHFYTYLGRRPGFPERIIDATLALQDTDGLFTFFGGGGSCEDLDAVDLLCRCLLYTEHRRHEVERALARAHAALWENQNRDGGFCWAKRGALSLRKLRHALRPSLLRVSAREAVRNGREKIDNQLALLLRPSSLGWAYSGVEAMRIRLGDSDLWSTWFRLLAIAEIELTFPRLARAPRTRWTMRRLPGLGFYRRAP